MAKSLEQVKTDLSEKYLGKHGIHGVSYRRSENAVVIYVADKQQAEQDDLQNRLKDEAGPYKVILHEEPAPELIKVEIGFIKISCRRFSFYLLENIFG